MKMPTLRFIVISSLLLFAIASTLLTAFRCKGGNNAGFVAASGDKVRPKKYMYVVAAAAAARGKTSKGRRMVVNKTTMLNKNAKINVVAKGKGKHTTFRRITLSGSKNVNFVAFTEDYYKPRHHPPKNN